MTIFTVLIDALTLVVCGIAMSGCGKEQLAAALPEPEPTVATADANPAIATATAAPTVAPTATPAPSPTLVTYIYQATTICAALHSWNPNTTTIKTYPTAGNSEAAYYLFRWDGVWYVVGGSEYVANVTLTRSDIHGVVCTITVANGALTGVTP
jgi:hypothetical protein